jgi:hypothetical protein
MSIRDLIGRTDEDDKILIYENKFRIIIVNEWRSAGWQPPFCVVRRA